MAGLRAVVVLALSLILLQVQWHTSMSLASATAAATRVVNPRFHRTLVDVPQQPQQTAGGEIPVRVFAQAPVVSSTSSSGHSELDGQVSPPVSTPPLDPGVCTYKVRTQTGDQYTAGTDSTISIRFENSQQDNVYMVLTAGAIKKGDLSTFSRQERCVPHICKMILYTDSRGWLPCWFPVFVDVSVTPVIAGTPAGQASDYQKWDVEEWLPPHEWNSATSLERDHCSKSTTTSLQIETSIDTMN